MWGRRFLAGLTAFSGISASCGKVESAAPNQPESGEERDAGTDVASVLDASADAEHDDARTDSTTADAPLCEALPVIPLDAGDPPSDCIPPCVWNAFKTCLSKGSSAQASVWCWECTRRVSQASCNYSVGGVGCYGIVQHRLGTVWSDGEGQVAWALRNGGSRVTVHCCGGSTGCDAGSEVYDVDVSADHCAPWRDVRW